MQMPASVSLPFAACCECAVFFLPLGGIACGAFNLPRAVVRQLLWAEARIHLWLRGYIDNLGPILRCPLEKLYRTFCPRDG